MDDASAEKVRPWLRIARNDLEAAKFLARLPETRGPAVYHCQQAAEKAIKAFLVASDQPFEKIHDIERLLIQAALFNPLFSHFAEAGAIEQAGAIYGFVLSILPETMHP